MSEFLVTVTGAGMIDDVGDYADAVAWVSFEIDGLDVFDENGDAPSVTCTVEQARGILQCLYGKAVIKVDDGSLVGWRPA